MTGAWRIGFDPALPETALIALGVLALASLGFYVWREGGEECVLPCAEVVISEPTVTRALEEGVMVAAPVRGTDRLVMRWSARLTPAAA